MTEVTAPNIGALREKLERASGESVRWDLDDHGVPRGYARGVIYGYTAETEQYVVACHIGGTWDGLVTNEHARDVIERHRRLTKEVGT